MFENLKACLALPYLEVDEKPDTLTFQSMVYVFPSQPMPIRAPQSAEFSCPWNYPDPHGGVYYAVARGRQPGIYRNWLAAQDQVLGFPRMFHRKFDNLNEAEAFVIANADSDKREEMRRELHARRLPVQGQDLIAFTSGVCANDGKARAQAGYAFRFISALHGGTADFDHCAPLEGLLQDQVSAEYTAVFETLRAARRIDPSGKQRLFVFTDSDFVIKSMTEGLPIWLANDWLNSEGADIKNATILKVIQRFIGRRTAPVHFRHVDAHARAASSLREIQGQVNKLAKSAAARKHLSHPTIPYQTLEFSDELEPAGKISWHCVFDLKGPDSFITPSIVDHFVNLGVIKCCNIKPFAEPVKISDYRGVEYLAREFVSLRITNLVDETCTGTVSEVFLIVDTVSFTEKTPYGCEHLTGIFRDFIIPIREDPDFIIVSGLGIPHKLNMCLCDEAERWEYIHPEYVAPGGPRDRFTFTASDRF